MVILIGIPCLLTGGTEIQTLSLVQALVQAGHKVAVVCYFEYSDAMAARYKDAGCNVYLLAEDGRRPAGVKNTLTFLYRGLKRVVQSLKPDIAHVQYMAPGAIPILILRLLGVKKIIATAHTAADIYKSLNLVKWLVKHSLIAFTCITERAERSFFGNSQLYSPELKLKKRGNHFTIYNNLPSYIAISDKPRQFNTPVTIGVVSRLERIKGMDLVVPAFAKVHARFPDSRLLVAGDGGLRSVMEEQVRENSLDEVVEFVGRQPQSALKSVYDRIDILLMPSRSEGFGLTAIEGMARGCAVVAADVGGLPEVVGGVGLLHKPEDIDDLAQKIECLLTDESRLGECSEAARKHVTRFSSETYSRLIADLYAKLSN